MARQEVLLAEPSTVGNRRGDFVPLGFCKESQSFSQETARLKHGSMVLVFFSPRITHLEFIGVLT